MFVVYFNYKQKENESFQDYTKRFKLSRNILTLHKGRDIVLQKIVKNYADYNATDETKLRETRADSDKRFSAYLYLHNSDMNKYYSLMKGLNSQYSLKKVIPNKYD